MDLSITSDVNSGGHSSAFGRTDKEKNGERLDIHRSCNEREWNEPGMLNSLELSLEGRVSCCW
jgi:hypothetical protein